MSSVEIELSKKQFDNLPYKTTVIEKEKTYGDIIGLLESHGISDYQWTRYQGTDQLAFPLSFERQGKTHNFAVKIRVPKLMYKKRVGRGRSGPSRLVYLEKVSWRIFWWYLKSKLEAIEYGISDEIREFMYNIHYSLPDGSEKSLGETLIENTDNLLKIHALEDQTQANVIEVEFSEKKNNRVDT